MTTLRRITVLVAAVSLILSGIALPAAHAGQRENNAGSQHRHQQHGKERSEPQRGRSQQGKRARFVVVGTVVSVADDASRTVTIAVKGGTRRLRGTEVTVSVTEDTIFKGGAWEDVTAGARIKIIGRRVEGDPVAWRVKIKRVARDDADDDQDDAQDEQDHDQDDEQDEQDEQDHDQDDLDEVDATV